jgi:hypothetical protein
MVETGPAHCYSTGPALIWFGPQPTRPQATWYSTRAPGPCGNCAASLVAAHSTDPTHLFATALILCESMTRRPSLFCFPCPRHLECHCSAPLSLRRHRAPMGYCNEQALEKRLRAPTSPSRWSRPRAKPYTVRNPQIKPDVICIAVRWWRPVRVESWSFGGDKG